MRDMMESILKNSDAVLGVEWKSGPNSSELLLEQEDGHGRMVFHPLFPGVTLAFIQVNVGSVIQKKLTSSCGAVIDQQGPQLGIGLGLRPV